MLISPVQGVLHPFFVVFEESHDLIEKAHGIKSTIRIAIYAIVSGIQY